MDKAEQAATQEAAARDPTEAGYRELLLPRRSPAKESNFVVPVPAWRGSPPDCGPYSVTKGWAAVKDVFNGKSILASWKRSADTHRAIIRFGDAPCPRTEEQCSRILHSVAGSTPVLVRCDTYQVDGVPGAPRDCEILAFLGSTRYMAVATRSLNPGPRCPYAVGFLDDRELSGTFDQLAVIRALAKHFRARHGFAAKALRREPTSALLTNFHKPSKPLAPLREDATVIVDLEADAHAIWFRSLVSLTVNEYATSENRDWHDPTSQQMEIYKDWLAAEFEKVIRGVCAPPRSVTREFNRYTCK